MLGSKSSERLLANIRNGLPMTQGEKLRLIVSLSVPSMLAQLTTVMMFFILIRQNEMYRFCKTKCDFFV